MSRYAWLPDYLARLAGEGVTAVADDRDALAPARRLTLAADDWGTAGRIAAAVGCRHAGLWGDPEGERIVIRACLARDGDYLVLETTVPLGQPVLGSHTPHFPGVDRLERHMQDLVGIACLNHPDSRRWTRHQAWSDSDFPLRNDFPVAGRAPGRTRADADYPFARVQGSGVYEIPVGPVHAGMIEPGHFRFSVAGETVLRLKARLWYVHRGVEKAFEGRPVDGAVALAERISGDTAAGHALAHSLAVESAAGVILPAAAERLRALLVELERLYNHAADLGALANDVGFSLANAHALRIREQLLRLNAEVTGHRLLRGAIRPGGVTLRALPDPQRLRSVAADLAEVTRLTLANTVVHDRFAGTSVLPTEDAQTLGCLGYVARASGVRTDARVEHPATELPVVEAGSTKGDVLARYQVRRDEFANSVELACALVDTHRGGLDWTVALPHGRGAGVGIAEGWRGTIVHRVEVDRDGRFTRSKIVDPSWFNWPALPVAMTDTIVPDFPLTNKSFNLSYAGNDL